MNRLNHSFHRVSASDAADSPQKVTILLVDDQPGKLLSYEAILGELGENLVKVASGREALEYLLKNDVAVVLTDVSMPGIDGFELADLMRQHPRFQKTAIIFISAIHLSDLDRIKGYERGAVDYISVPVVPELLRAKVSLFAELHRNRIQLERLNQELEQRVVDRTEELSERADLLDLATDAIIVRDMNGVVRFWNSGAETLFGWRREEIMGQNLHKVLATKWPVPPSRVEASLTETGRWEGNIEQLTRSGEKVTVACRKALKIGGLGTPEAILEISRDITASLRAEEALRTAEKLAAMGRVAGIIAHEINNPLEAIHNIFHLIRHHPSLDAEAVDYARMAEEELSRVTHIVKQTLSFYRESQQPVEVSIPEVLDNVLELQSRNIHLQNVILEKRYLTDATIQGFPGELRQVFMNLISNAVQAMPTGGRLRVTIDEHTGRVGKGNAIAVSVSDTGSGIKPDHVKHLFEPFFTTKAAKGTGLGLWISKGIIQKYDGSIRFRSFVHPKMNATSFRVTLPVQMSAQRLNAQPTYSMSRG
ncbi:MAG TPA: ATP-binding protein [Silvibacterium sp.]|nr:ATP-binding protein [Silvibacterium sp.]